MAKKLKTVRGLIVAEYSAKEKSENGGYSFGVYTRDEWEQPQGFRQSDMDFDTIESALEWAASSRNPAPAVSNGITIGRDLFDYAKWNGSPVQTVGVAKKDLRARYSSLVNAYRSAPSVGTLQDVLAYAKALKISDTRVKKDLQIKVVNPKRRFNPSDDFKQALSDEKDRARGELDALEAIQVNPKGGRFTKFDALETLARHGIDINKDYFSLRTDEVNALYMMLKQAGYRGSSTSPRSLTQQYWYALQRFEAKNPRGTGDEHAARELYLYITNDSQLMRQQGEPIYKNLATKSARGNYDTAKAVKLAMYLMESGAKKYVREFGGGQWSDVFNKPTREIAAREFVEFFEAENALGNYDRMLPAKYRKNASYSEVDFFDDKQLDQISAEFQGGINGETFEAVAADSTPSNVVRLGHLRKLVIDNIENSFEIDFGADEDAWLAADRRKNLYFVGKDARLTSGQKPRKGQLKWLGKLTQLNYVTTKAHIESGSETEYFHELGEVDGAQPDLYVDHDNMLVLIGGNYDIWTCGIVN